jgi:hypothetical protein
MSPCLTSYLVVLIGRVLSARLKLLGEQTTFGSEVSTCGFCQGGRGWFALKLAGRAGQLLMALDRQARGLVTQTLAKKALVLLGAMALVRANKRCFARYGRFAWRITNKVNHPFVSGN